jgi:hypothetical protein
MTQVKSKKTKYASKVEEQIAEAIRGNVEEVTQTYCMNDLM